MLVPAAQVSTISRIKAFHAIHVVCISTYHVQSTHQRQIILWKHTHVTEQPSPTYPRILNHIRVLLREWTRLRITFMRSYEKFWLFNLKIRFLLRHQIVYVSIAIMHFVCALCGRRAGLLRAAVTMK